jgi:hypothetical protein
MLTSRHLTAGYRAEDFEHNKHCVALKAWEKTPAEAELSPMD